jgi:iron complex transport system substrate-binding protein
VVVFLWPTLIAVPAAMAQTAAGTDAMVKAEETASSGEGYLFPHRARITHARGFTLKYQGGFKQLDVLTPWRGARETFSYLLVPRGQKPPEDIPRGATVVEVPVRRIVLSSTACAALLPMLHVEDTLVGFSGAHLVNSPRILELIRQGRVEEVGAGGDGMARQLNMERLFALQPDLVVVHGTGIPEFDHHPKLMEAGFKTAVYSNYMESTPLGRTEWIKFLAAFFNKEAEAGRIFDEIVQKYETMSQKARNVDRRPTVFYGMTYQSAWYTPAGGSYMARFIRDAGGDYVWSDDRTTGSMPVAMEVLLERAREADIWLDPGLCTSLDELAASDERYALFRAFQTGRVYNNNARTGPGGGNDYWEGGMARPDLVLADLISIFHPELVPGHERIWYRKLSRNDGGKP